MDFLQEALERQATDLHVEAGGRAAIRSLGKIIPFASCGEEAFQALLVRLATHATVDISIVDNIGEKVKDFSSTVPDIGRVRVRCYRSQNRQCLAIRFLPEHIPSPDELRWPLSLRSLCSMKQGLILVTGASGSGKSTTLAALIEQINSQRECHILTFESPVEYVFHDQRAFIHQCAVPEDVPSFLQGAQDALRMDVDVVMLGELSELDTMRAALKLAESGHLVLATMHTGSAAEAVGYFLNHFPAHEHPLVCHQLAAMLQAVVSQRLLLHCREDRWVPAYELLLRNTAVARQIREQDFSQLLASMELGRSEGMILLEDQLASLVKNKEVCLAEALATANAPERLKQLLRQ